MYRLERLPGFPLLQGMSWRDRIFDSVTAVSGTLLITAVIYIFHLYPNIPNISLVYLLIVLALASTRGMYAAVLAALVAVSSFDFFLIPPLYTFTIAKTEEWLALFVFLATAIITGQLASALRRRAEEANRREHETRILYDLVRKTNSEEDVEQQLNIVARTIVEVFSAWGVYDCSILLPDNKNTVTLQTNALQPVDQVSLSDDEKNVAALVMRQAEIVELHDVALAHGYFPRAITRSTHSQQPVRRYVRMLPLKMGQKVVGVVRLLMEDKHRLFRGEKMFDMQRERGDQMTTFFWTFLDHAASIIERARLRRESLQVEVLQRTDELRAALLSSVSHDLRTPLSSIKAAASSLLQEDVQWDDEARRSFALSIEHEADRLNRFVGNMLDMSRIEGGALKPEKEWYPFDELVHDVLGHMETVLQGRDVLVDLPDDLPPVQLDYLQIDQVLTNLIENALRYTPTTSPIEIRACVEGDMMVVRVADRGPGIAPEEREHVFDKFYRVLGTQRSVGGSGLGLAVCKGLVEAHGGSIWMENRPGGGAIFYFTLPVEKIEDIPV